MIGNSGLLYLREDAFEKLGVKEDNLLLKIMFLLALYYCQVGDLIRYVTSTCCHILITKDTASPNR
jgi:hypothetical protein